MLSICMFKSPLIQHVNFTVEGLALYYFDFGPNPLFTFYCFLISPKRRVNDSFTKRNSCWTNSNFNAQQFYCHTVRNLPLFDRLK